MAQTAGIIIEHNAKGVLTLAHIDLRKYGDKLKDFFVSEGISIGEWIIYMVRDKVITIYSLRGH